MWYKESMQEISRWSENTETCHDFAIYPKRFYKAVSEMNGGKVYDFCFIGSFKTDRLTIKNRKWIIKFIEKNFTNKSYLQFTDENTKKNYGIMGAYDFTLKKTGFVPKNHEAEYRNKFDDNYFKTMCKSKFTLCPAGDKYYSMRFYESLMCKSIPVVKSKQETFRSEEESKLNYKYYLTTDEIVYREEWVEHNYDIFLRHHTFEYRVENP